jgi:uncharacterized protein (TIGR03437 family)
MTRAWLLGALVAAGLQLRAADGAVPIPTYTADSIVHSADFSSGPLAPNTPATIFGVNLSYSTGQPNSDGRLPTQLAGVSVFVANTPASLLYVSEKQINFLVPDWLRPGDVTLRVTRQGVTGPNVTITLADAAPALFRGESDVALATHGGSASIITATEPAAPGDLVVIYATGLGQTGTSLGEVPVAASQIKRLSDFQILLNGEPVDRARIAYAGVTPGCWGLYQINVFLPDHLADDPEIRVGVGDQWSAAGLKLPVRQPQLSPQLVR